MQCSSHVHFSLVQINIQRLKEYKEKLILFPKKKLAKPGKGEASVEEQAAAVQYEGTLMPLSNAAPVIETMQITAEMKEGKSCYSQLREAINDKRMVGIRKKMKEEKEEAEKNKKKK